MTGIPRVTGYASHSSACPGPVQWIATLSVPVYRDFVLITRVDQVRDPALHRIELKTARSTGQRLHPLYLVGDEITIFFYTIYNTPCSGLGVGVL